MRISGDGGRLRVGYHTAAEVGRWTLTRVRAAPTQAYEANATLTDVDTFWSEQGPMDLALVMGSREWRWSNVAPRLSGQSLAVTLEGGPAIH